MLNVRSISISAAMLMLMFCAPLASAAPVFDGNVTAGDGYQYRFQDGIAPSDDEAPFLNSDWDIDAVTLAVDPIGGWAYVGLDVVGTFDRNGSGTTPWSKSTVFTGLFSTPSGDRTFEFTSTASGQTLTMDGVAVPAADWAAAYGNDLELKIKSSYVADIVGPVFSFFGGLDDRGISADDFVAAVAPEPGSMALLAMGGIAALIRRRRK